MNRRNALDDPRMTRDGSRLPFPHAEAGAWLLCAAFLQLLYVAGAALGRDDLFGISRPRGISSVEYAAGAIVAVMAVAAYVVGRTSSFPRVRLTPAVLAAAVGAVFWILRNNFINQDGVAFERHFRSMSGGTVYVTADEILEYAIHARAWDFTERWWGWSVFL